MWLHTVSHICNVSHKYSASFILMMICRSSERAVLVVQLTKGSLWTGEKVLSTEGYSLLTQKIKGTLIFHDTTLLFDALPLFNYFSVFFLSALWIKKKKKKVSWAVHADLVVTTRHRHSFCLILKKMYHALLVCM